jgi:hypothetical protein
MSSGSTSLTQEQQQSFQQPSKQLKLQLQQQQYQQSPSLTLSGQQSRLDQLPPPAFSNAHSLSFGNSLHFGNGLANSSSSGLANARGTSSSSPFNNAFGSSSGLPNTYGSSNDAISAATAAAGGAVHVPAGDDVSPFVTHGRSMVLTGPLASISSLDDVLPTGDQNSSSVQMQPSAGMSGHVTDSPFAFALPAGDSTSSSFGNSGKSAVQAAAAAGGRRHCTWLRILWLLLAPQLKNTWALLASIAVAAMAYCYTLFSSVVVSAFSCMPLAGKPTVPGEILLTARVWVPDMQLQCYSGQHMAVAAMAAFVGIPMLAVYLLLLVVLAMPKKQQEKTADGDNSDSSSSNQHARSSHIAAAAVQQPLPTGPHPAAAASAAAAQAAWQGISAPPSRRQRLVTWWQRAVRAPLRRLLAAVLRPFSKLAYACQRVTAGRGIDGSQCVGCDVWNQEHRWWWLPLRECVKLAVLITVVVNSMHASFIQGPLVLLMVLLAAVLIWKLQPGCSTSMNWLLYVMYCLWQLLALLVLVLAVPGVNAAAFGGVLLAMLCIVMANAFVTLGSLVWRCAQAVSPSAEQQQQQQQQQPETRF